MYVKLFSSLYQGTLRGNSRCILVFTNLLAHCDSAGHVDMHPKAIAEEVGLTVEQVKEALLELESPDPESRSPDEEGKRIKRLDEHRAWGWLVVNYAKYRAIRNEEERREQNREAQRRWRERQSDVSAVSRVSRGKPKEKEKEKKEKPQRAAATVSRPESVSEQVWADWLSLRKSKRAPVTETVIESAIAEAGKAGMQVEDFLRVWCARGSQGLQAEWLKPHERIRSVDQSERERMFRRAL